MYNSVLQNSPEEIPGPQIPAASILSVNMNNFIFSTNLHFYY